MSNVSIGTWLSLPDESIAEIFANAGYEWVVIDLEHSAITIHQAANLIRVINLAGSKPFVRLSGHDASQIKRVLDAGAKGILAPMIETKSQIEHIISACRYPAEGIRGMGLARAQGYGEQHLKSSYIENASHEVEIYAQIESMEGTQNCNEIFSTDISGYFLGPYDLSASLGAAGVFTSNAFKESEDKILKTAADHKIKCGYHLVEPEAEKINDLKERGYNMIAFSVDIRMLDVTARLPFTHR